MMFRDNQNWNSVNEKNISECLHIIDQYGFEHLQLPSDVQDFILDLASNHKCDPKVLFYAILSGIGHFSEAINVYNIETKQVKPITVYEVLIAPSGVEKSKYINIISNSCTKLEVYLYENYYKQQRCFSSSDVLEAAEEGDEKKKNNIKNFEYWINEFGSIKQVYTTASLLQMMSNKSLYFLANEGDAILQESSFYNPADVTADVKQGTLIDCWDGNKIVKSTVSHGSKEIKNRTVSKCVASTGRRWPDLLRELSKVQIAGGLHERCTYFCFDVTGDIDLNQLTPITEKQFYSSLYDNLLSSVVVNNQVKFSLVQIFFIVKLFGYRIFIWSKESFAFLQPRLNELKLNKPCQLIHETTVFRTKQRMAIRRRSAEHVVRYGCLNQMLTNGLKILKSMDENIIKCCGGSINELFEIEARKQINKLFGVALEREKAFHENYVPIQPLEVDIEATESAVALVFSFLLPQSVLLFNYENYCETKSSEELVIDSVNMKMSKQEKVVFRIEKLIMELNYKFFFKSSITDRYFRDKRLLVDHVLNDLVGRKFLYEGHDDTSFFDTGRASSIKTYLKYLPNDSDEKNFRQSLKNVYNIEYDDYKKIFEDATLLPPNCHLTSYGLQFIRQPQYQSMIKKADTNVSNTSPDGSNTTDENTPTNFTELSEGQRENNGDQREQSTNDFNHINQNPAIITRNNSSQHKITVDYSLENIKDSDYDQNISPTANNYEETPIVFHDSSNNLSPVDNDDTEKSQEKQMSRDTESIDKRKLRTMDSSSKNNNNETKTKAAIKKTIKDNEILKKILLIPSILIAKGLIALHIKSRASEINNGINYLVEKELLKVGKYLICGNRHIETFLKYVPENIEDRTCKYLLQRRLLEVDVNVNEYIESLKSIKIISTSHRPSSLLMMTLQEAPYDQLNISLVMKRKGRCKETSTQEDEISSNDEARNHTKERKKARKNVEYE
ncbi:unnamed protein product [Rotaria socialis]